MSGINPDQTVAERFVRCNLYELQQTATVAHGGVGQVLFHRLATSETLDGACNFIDFTTMPPGTTIGKHTHRSDEEEFYLILKGTGTLQLGDDEFSVGPGDLVRNPPGGTHSLRNVGDGELQLFVFEVQVR